MGTARVVGEYSGFRVSFGNAHPPKGKFFAYGFKAPLKNPGSEFTDITIPFNAFSDYWDDATGDIITPCSADKTYCPDAATLKDMRTITLWAEGVAGSVHMEVKRFFASGCSTDSVQLSANVSVYSIEDGKCGQVELNPLFVKPAMAFNKDLKKGTCESVGYTVPDGTMSKHVPIVGTITIKLYEKPSLLDDSDMVVLEDFSSPVHNWKQMNDPVMGGRSTGSFSISGGVGVFNGSVVDVPFLHAPGFIKVAADQSSFPDVSMCTAFGITARVVGEYSGFRVSFGNAHPPKGKFFAYGFKAPLKNPGSEFTDITIPFNAFSDYWDDATGDIITPCSADKTYCPDAATLKDMRTITLWAEGIAGSVHMEVKRFFAADCGSKRAVTTVPRGVSREYDGEVVLEDFSAPSHTWQELNDPVMGGQSTGTFSVTDGIGVFNGSVVDVPFLHAPGFITVRAVQSTFPDVSSCTSFGITARAVGDYKGFRISFGTAHPADAKRHAYGYKAPLVNPGAKFKDITIPFDAFSDLWDDATGDIITPCSSNEKYCPDDATLRDMRTIQLWGEGVAGDVYMEVKRFYASGCATSKSSTKSVSNTKSSAKPSKVVAFNSTCVGGGVQPKLRFNLTNNSSALASFPFPLPSDVPSLPDAIC